LLWTPKNLPAKVVDSERTFFFVFCFGGSQKKREREKRGERKTGQALWGGYVGEKNEGRGECVAVSHSQRGMNGARAKLSVKDLAFKKKKKRNDHGRPRELEKGG